MKKPSLDGLVKRTFFSDYRKKANDVFVYAGEPNWSLHPVAQAIYDIIKRHERITRADLFVEMSKTDIFLRNIQPFKVFMRYETLFLLSGSIEIYSEK